MGVKAPRGMHDILPDDADRWQLLEARIRHFAARYGYREIRTPLVEHTEVFQRTAGETSDIVEREMYTFADRSGRSLSLRPEGTAGVMRAYLEHGMATLPQPVRLFYIGPMFRYDRPQKGRYRMHHQFGAEVIGASVPAADVEVLSLPVRVMQSLGLVHVQVRLNSVGDATCRPAYLAVLRRYLGQHQTELCAACQRRIEVNPLRIFDCKEPHCHEIARGAPVMLDHLCPECRAHFDEVKRLLGVLDIPYVEDPLIVRGLDYYTRTAAEVYSGRLGAQNAVLGAGRYDGLAEQLGGSPTPGVGFGQGLERLLLVLQGEGLALEPTDPGRGLDVFAVAVGEGPEREAFRLLDRIRAEGIGATGDLLGRSLRAQMKLADRLGVRYALILGEEELAAREAGVRDMRTGVQEKVPLDAVVSHLRTKVKG